MPARLPARPGVDSLQEDSGRSSPSPLPWTTPPRLPAVPTGVPTLAADAPVTAPPGPTESVARLPVGVAQPTEPARLPPLTGMSGVPPTEAAQLPAGRAATVSEALDMRLPEPRQSQSDGSLRLPLIGPPAMTTPASVPQFGPTPLTAPGQWPQPRDALTPRANFPPELPGGSVYHDPYRHG